MNDEHYQVPAPFTIEFAGQSLQLHPDKAIYWHGQKALLVADMHLGKIQHFIRNGIPLPTVTESINLAKLQDLLLQFEPQTVYILGDLFHSDWNEAWAEFELFVKAFHDVSFHLILGNHDVLPDGMYKQGGLDITRGALYKDPFLLMHIAEPGKSSIPTISGHIHPGATLRGRGRQSIKLPCFWIKNNNLILPAFGHYTGLATIKATREDKIYVVAQDQIMDLSAP